MSKPTPELVDLTSVDFCIATTGDRAALENLLESIVGRHTNATITIADNTREVDRAYYKSLMADLAESGLSNRVRIHQAPYQADLSAMHNMLASNTSNKYKLFISEDMIFGEDTDIAAMVSVLDRHPSIGVVVGGVDGKVEVEKRDTELHEKGHPPVFRTSRIASPFIMVHTDVLQRVRFISGDEGMQRFTAALPQIAAFGIAALPDVFILSQSKDGKTQTPKPTNANTTQATEPSGAGNGDTTKSDVQGSDAGDEGDSDSTPSGQATQGENHNTTGRSGRGGAGPVPGK